ncbi:endonuclease domain-containing protein [Sphingomonas sp.]|uniref:endonuclease domain-containing protein n=1 Tax=Sphingomonas sp. TaxID=28214 RepID=UPI003B3A8686
MPQTRYNEGDQSVARSRQLRRDSTPAEQRLWSALRGASLDGRKFRRQQRLGIYFGDFVCQSARLVMEVDGRTHEGPEAAAKDERRTAFLEHEGYRVVRFTNAEVMKNIEGVVGAIRAMLLSAAPSPAHASHGHPLPQAERAE